MSTIHNGNDKNRDEYWWYHRATPEQLAALDGRHSQLDEDGDDEFTALRRFHEKRGFWDANDPSFDGVDARGFKLGGQHIETQSDRDADGFDWRGHDRRGYNRAGWNRNGFNLDGEHRNGTLRDDDGVDADGYAEDGFTAGDRTGRTAFPARDRQGFDLRGRDENDRNRQGHYQGVRRASIWWVSDGKRPHYLPEGWRTDRPRTVFPYTRMNVRPDDIRFECTHGSIASGAYPLCGVTHLSLHWKAQECFVLGQRLADDRKAGVVTPHMDVLTVRWVSDLEKLQGDAVREMPHEQLSYERRDRQMMALALRAGLGYAEPTRRELIEFGYEEAVRHYSPTLKWRKRSTLGSAA